jgi:hypothetical protein
MGKVSMATFAASIDKSGFFQLADEFSDFPGHWMLSLFAISIASIDIVLIQPGNAIR